MALSETRAVYSSLDEYYDADPKGRRWSEEAMYGVLWRWARNGTHR